MNTYWRRYFAWSKSRVELFRDCRKRYSFQYLFKWERSPAAAMAKELSRLATLAIRKGTLVHEEIERFVRAAEGGDEPGRADSRDRLATAFDVLAAHAGSRVLEARFGRWRPDEAAARVAAAKEDALFQLDRFHEEVWPRYAPKEVLSCEALEKVPVGEQSMWVSADLVVREPGGELVLADWKTGTHRHPADDSLQLTAYVYWAAERWEVPPERIRAELVWLASGEVDATTRSADDLTQLRERVAADCAEMLALDSYEQVTASPGERKCPRCPFLPLCREGQEVQDFMDDAARRRLLDGLRAETG